MRACWDSPNATRLTRRYRAAQVLSRILSWSKVDLPIAAVYKIPGNRELVFTGMAGTYRRKKIGTAKVGCLWFL